MNPNLAKLQPYPFEKLRLPFKAYRTRALHGDQNGTAGADGRRGGLGRRNTCGGKPPADGKYNLYCAIIVKRVDAKTRAKTSINELLCGD